MISRVSSFAAPAGVTRNAPGIVSVPPSGRVTRTEYGPGGTAPRLKVAVIWVYESTPTAAAGYDVPPDDTSATAVPASKPTPASVSVAGTLAAWRSGTTPVTLTSVSEARSVKPLGEVTDWP